MAIVSYIDFVNNYLIKNGLIGNATNMNKAADQLKKEIDEVIAGNKGADILTKLKTVDGTGSGLDADLLDGKDSATTNIVNTIVARDGSGNFSAGTITAALTGNASTASTLQTGRTINGVSFDGSANITVSDTTAVKLTGNQTIADAKTFSSNIVGNITGNAATATKLATARTINGVAFDGSANITVSDTTAVKLTGNQTIDGIKTFSSNIVGNITGNAATATTAADSNKLIGKNWHWSGQGGQPTWLWGGSDDTNMYVYNPANFNVNYANTAGVANNALGVGQTWQNVTASRVLGATYTNSTGKPIMVFVTKNNITNSTWEFYINGVSIGYINAYGTHNSTSIIIPNGSTYMADTVAGILVKWVELR